jgi:tripartite-type tricarboxylate transporter receptor subunit TctC
MVHIPFKGGSLSTAAVMSGDVDLSFANITDALPQIEAGTVRGIGVTGLERSPFLPDMPSIHETVAPNFLAESWNGIMAPAKTPEPIISKLSDVLLKMADDPEIKEQMRKSGASTVKSTPAHFRGQIEQEMAQWKPMVAEILAKEAAKEKEQAKK